MQSSLEKLRKFFRLEAENKYANTAVIGGLSKILDFWEAEARNEGVPEELIQLVATRLRDYDRLTPVSRADTLKGVWKRVQGHTGETDTASPAQAGKPPKPEPASSGAIQAAEATLPAAEAPPQASPPADVGTALVAPQRPAPAARPPRVEQRRDSAPRRSPAPRASTYPGAQTSQTPVALNASLTVLQGVGPKNATLLEKLGLQTLGDMLYYFPRRYDDYSQLKPIRNLFYGEVVTVVGTVDSIVSRPIRGGKMQIIEAVISDGTGALRITWFNQP